MALWCTCSWCQVAYPEDPQERLAVMTELDIDGHVDDQGNQYLGKATRQPGGEWHCLAVVGGALCRVEVRLTGVRASNEHISGESRKTEDPSGAVPTSGGDPPSDGSHRDR